MQDTLLLLRQFIRYPRRVSSIAPSSRALGRSMAEWIEWDDARNVVEFGPGTGALTEHILPRLRSDARFFAVERDKRFVEHLRKRFPGMNVCRGCVGNLRALCEQHEMPHIDAIISGIPWAGMTAQETRACLEPTLEMLRPGGQFTTYAYIHGYFRRANVRMRRMLRDNFSEVRVTRLVWANVPPAILYRCRK